MKDLLEEGLVAWTVHDEGKVPDFRRLADPANNHYAETYEWVAKTNPRYYQSNMLSRRGVFQDALAWAKENECSSVLEIACGNGEGINAFADEGMEAYGVDVNRRLLESVALACPRERVAAADARRLPFKTGAFDFVVSVDFLEHIREDDLPLVLGEIARVSRCAYLVVSCADAINKGPDGRSLHETVRKAPWWLEAMKAHGLRVEKSLAPGSALHASVRSSG